MFSHPVSLRLQVVQVSHGMQVMLSLQRVQVNHGMQTL